MSTHSICFCGKMRKYHYIFGIQKAPYLEPRRPKSLLADMIQNNKVTTCYKKSYSTVE